MRMGCIDQPLERFWAAIGVLWSERIHTVVAPVSRPGKLSDGH